MRWHPAIIAVCCAAWVDARAAAAGDVACYADWSVAAPIVKQEGLATVEALTLAARAKLKGDILKTTLCRENGVYVYRVVLRGADGRLTQVTVNAKSPFGG